MKNIDSIHWKFAKIEPVELEKEMELGQEIDIHIKGSVVRKITDDNQDGSVNITYVIAPLTINHDNK